MTIAPETDRTLPAVIFVHGLRTSGAIWSHQVRTLEDAGHRTRIVDLPGHGGRRDQRFTMPGAFAAIDQAVGSLPPGTPYVLVGLSLGGYTVLHYAAARRGALRATAAGEGSPVPAPSGSTPPGASPDGGRAHDLVGVLASSCSSDPSTKPVLLYRDVAALVAASGGRLRTLLGALSWPVHRKGAARRRVFRFRPLDPDRPTWEVVTDALTQLQTVSSVEDLRSIDVPVALVNGRWDHLRLEERRHHRARAGISLVVIDGAGHDVSTQVPERFGEALVHFVESLAPSAPHTAPAASAALVGAQAPSAERMAS